MTLTSDELMNKMVDLRTQLVYLNNQHLIKWKKMIGPNYKVLPYLVDKNLKAKPKKTRESIGHLQQAVLENDFQKIFYFKQSCGHAAVKFRVSDFVNLPKCGFLHHFDPYLRLGPFKVEVIKREPYIR